MKTITVFGSGNSKEDDKEYIFACELGEKLAKANFNICCGGYFGSMEAVSKGASGCEVEITGVTLSQIKASCNKFITNEIKTSSLFERLKTLIEIGDGFVVLSGGTGTLLEFSAILELVNKKIIQNKPVVAADLIWKNIFDLMGEKLKKEGNSLHGFQYIIDANEIVKYFQKVLSH